MNRPDPNLSEANVAMPLRLSRRFPNSRLVLASSVAIYGRAPSPRTEESPFVAPDEYGWTKLAAEAVVRQHRSFGIVRLSSLYGPGMRAPTFLPALVRTARESGRIVLFGDGMRSQDYLHVLDAARMLGIVATQHQNGTFLGASGQATSNLDVATLVARALPGTRIGFEGTDDSPSVSYDVDLTRRRTGFTPSISMDEGIRSMVNP
jgi:nucleoside-diphosphate-sugar epimerase